MSIAIYIYAALFEKLQLYYILDNFIGPSKAIIVLK